MVFPSPACVTCKRRRVKCDTTRPSCGQCHKASRHCTWESNTETGLPFRSENAFAQGKPRRPWKRPANESRRDITAAATPSTLIARTLTIPVETHAFNYFVQSFTVWPNEMPDIGQDYLTYALAHYDRARPDSSLHLAVSAFSLASFGRARRVSRALEAAHGFYARSITTTQKELSELADENLDHLVVATLLMSQYENTMYGAERESNQDIASATPDEVGSRFWKKICHYEGTMGLLRMRQQRGLQNLPLYRAVRRPVLRACILRGKVVPDWLQDGSQYGEEGPALDLDLLMIRVAALRCASLKIFRDENPDPLSPCKEVEYATMEAQNLETALTLWPHDLPEEWKFSAISTESSMPSKTNFADTNYVHSYTTHGHAAVWIRYLAVCLIVSSIHMRLLSISSHSKPQRPAFTTQLEACQERIDLLAAHMCRSVPFFFSSRNATDPKDEIMLKFATLLTWPLTVAISIEAIPLAQKQWLQRRLKSVAVVLADGVIQSAAEKDAFKF
ncbi:hypothetical protein BP5796_12645 [Coleophoma crateriformis]|uniref:Zn(2)-C6 fungal-type domain-containing protein n=1 Tax=Coleophoma crateriformis TaxID=565419 RepID=A0A3D8Q5R9_9HELO|nr:hypothetical protein BP5796_12645 [Coleophoma crateriformis]